MNYLVVDTSVIIKWFHPEENSKEADILLEKIQTKQLKITLPQSAPLELLNVLYVTKAFPLEKTHQSLNFFFDLKPEFIAIDKFSSPRIIDLAYEYNLTSYDAAFIELARSRNIPIFTADYKHHQKSISPLIIHLKDWNGKI